MRFRNENGFSLIEIVLATVLLAGTVAMIFNSFSSVTRWTKFRSNTAANLNRHTLEELNRYVRTDWWASGSSFLTPGAHAAGAQVVDNVTYTQTYTVTEIGGATGYRKVEATSTWPE